MDLNFLNDIEPKIKSMSRVTKGMYPNTLHSFGHRKVVDYELDYITWGEGTIITDGKKTPATRGYLYLRRPGMYTEGLLPYNCYYLRLELFTKKMRLVHLPNFIIFNNPSTIESLFSKLYSEYIHQKVISPFIIKTLLMEIFMCIYNEWVLKTRCRELYDSTGISQSILTATQYVENNLNNQFRLEDLATISGYSKYTFCRAFKKITGSTPIEYVNICRINNTKKLLLETDKSVKSIMLECGYRNDSYFFTLFKKQVGMTPLKYREMNRLW